MNIRQRTKIRRRATVRAIIILFAFFLEGRFSNPTLSDSDVEGLLMTRSGEETSEEVLN